MKMKSILLTLILFFSSQLHAGFRQRVELMKYAINQEKLHPVETKWKVSFFDRFKLIEEAEAYREGDVCMVLGFKSHFTNGMCRLSKAEGIGDYKKQCGSGSLPCNPQVFGKASSTKPFCVAENSGPELSKYCAHKSFVHVAKRSKSPALKDIQKTRPQEFDLSVMDLSQVDEATATAFDSLFTDNDSTKEAAAEFMSGLCSELENPRKDGMQPMDANNCNQYLAILKNKESETSPEQAAAPKPADVTSSAAPAYSNSSSAKLGVEQQVEDCDTNVPSVLTPPAKETIKDVLKVAETKSPASLYSCFKSLQQNSALPSGAAGPYLHNFDGKEMMGVRCKFLDHDNEKEKIFAFAGPDGFKVLHLPVFHYTVANPEGGSSRQYMPKEIIPFRTDKQNYYLSEMKVIADNFDSLSEVKLDGYIKEKGENPESMRRRYVQKYTSLLKDKGLPLKVAWKTPLYEQEADLTSCIEYRLEWMVNTVLGNSFMKNDEMQRDSQDQTNNPDLKIKYARSVEQVKSELKNEFNKKNSGCNQNIDSAKFDQLLEKSIGPRFIEYQKTKKIIDK